jgi:TRAP-type C4-dicarboxylate transport system permease small subunit
MKTIRAIVDGVDRVFLVPRAVIGALILAGIALNFANVVGRYLFAAPIPWAEEVMIFGLIWCIFLGAALVERDDDHLKVDLLPTALPPGPARAVRWLGTAIVVATCVFIVPQSLDVVLLLADFDDRTTVARLPKWLMHAAIAAGFVLIILATVLNIRRRIVRQAAPRDREPAA